MGMLSALRRWPPWQHCYGRTTAAAATWLLSRCEACQHDALLLLRALLSMRLVTHAPDMLVQHDHDRNTPSCT